MVSKDDAGWAVEVRCKVKNWWPVSLGLAGGFALALGGIAWFVFTWRDPNIRFSFIDDDVMRVRSAVFIAVGLDLCVTLVRWIQLARGSRPIGVVRAVEAGVEVTQCSYSWWGRARTRVVSNPVDLRVAHKRKAHGVSGLNLRVLRFRGPSGAFAVTSLWDFDENSVAELRSRLSALGEGSES